MVKVCSIDGSATGMAVEVKVRVTGGLTLDIGIVDDSRWSFVCLGVYV